MQQEAIAAIIIKINDKEFDVRPDGTIYQERSSSGVELDEARLAAAPEFLAQRGNHLTKEQRRHWAGVMLKTDIRNFSSSHVRKH